jgi:chromosome partitioning protein
MKMRIPGPFVQADDGAAERERRAFPRVRPARVRPRISEGLYTMRIIVVVNQKGGCGKTTTAVNLAAALAERQQRVLLVDLDPQGHATLGVGYDPDLLERTVYDALSQQPMALADVIRCTKMDRLSVAPASVILAGAEIELSQMADRERVLGRQLRSVDNRYDTCVIDCAPAFGILTISALIASDDVLVPVQAHYYSLEGLRRVMETIHLIRERFHHDSAGRLSILLTLVEDRTTLSKQIQLQMREILGPLVFNTVIHNNVRLCEAPSAGEPVLLYAPRSRGAREYRALAGEILGSATSVEPVAPGPDKRGMQKDLATMFDGMATIEENMSLRSTVTRGAPGAGARGENTEDAGPRGKLRISAT